MSVDVREVEQGSAVGDVVVGPVDVAVQLGVVEAMVDVPDYDADPAALGVDGVRAAVNLSMMMRH